MAMTLEDRLVKELPRAVVHLRAQRKAGRFGLIFGAGIGIDLGYPQWPDLVSRIANHANVGATRIWNRLEQQGTAGRPVTRSLASVTQMLFSQFRRRQIKQHDLPSSLTYVQELSIPNGLAEDHSWRALRRPISRCPGTKAARPSLSQRVSAAGEEHAADRNL